MIRTALPFLLLAVGITPLKADWLQFRGPNAAAVADSEIADEVAVAWKSDLPGRGLSCPIVVGDRVFVTCSSGPEQRTLHVICFSAEDGSQLWERTVAATGRTMSHKKTCVAAPTPCSDGQRIFALYSSNDLLAFDLDGNLLWLRGLTFDYPNASNSLGMASSPVVVGDTLVVQSENDSESLALGIDVKTGENRWKMERPKAANWTSSVVLDEVVALQSSAGLTGIDPHSGKVLWNYQDGASTIPSSVVDGDRIYVPSNGITALQIDGGSTSQLWREDGLRPGTASPVVVGDALFVINRSGVLIKADRSNGEELWKARLQGPFSGSPVAVGTRLYIAGERGDFQVVEVSGEEGSIAQSIDLGDTLLSTPAVSDNALFVRSDGHLWKIQ